MAQGDVVLVLETAAGAYGSQFEPTAITAAKVNLSSAGLRLGTASSEKVGFYGATPVVLPASADQTLLITAALGTPSGVTLEKLSEAEGSYYLTAGASVSLASGTPGAASDLCTGGTTVSVVATEFTHASPGSMTYTGAGTTIHFVICASVLVTNQAREAHVYLRRTRGGTPTNIAQSQFEIKTGAASQTSAFILQCRDTAQTNDVYTIVAEDNSGSGNTFTLQTLSFYAQGSIDNSYVNTNDAKIAELTNALQAALLNLGLIKGSA